MIEIFQKIVQIGSNEGIIVPEKDLTRLGAKRGDMLKVRAELVKEPGKYEDPLHEYDLFIEKYGQTLKNLAN